jgi:putative spermidine/putrescine transport system ATP-binding protein
MKSSSGIAVELDGLTKRFGALTALNNFSLDIAPAELVALLGPSGCGKTTALRILAGLDVPTEGRIVVDGKEISHIPANKRNMGMVFQAYSLFPSMSAQENVAYGLRVRGMKPGKRTARAKDLLELVGLGTHARHLPNQLSGGQQQRVALARALAIEPSVLLLDEPLSALDAKVRTQLRDEIKRIQREVGTTTLFVTHDQEEAMAIADRVGIMSAGNLEQCAPPSEVYLNPVNVKVAKFVGAMNALPGVLTSQTTADVLGQTVVVRGDSLDGRKDVRILIRPEQLSLHLTPEASAHSATIISHSFLGPLTRITARLNRDQTNLFIALPSAQAIGFPLGSSVNLVITADHALIEN